MQSWRTGRKRLPKHCKIGFLGFKVKYWSIGLEKSDGNAKPWGKTNFQACLRKLSTYSVKSKHANLEIEL